MAASAASTAADSSPANDVAANIDGDRTTGVAETGVAGTSSANVPDSEQVPAAGIKPDLVAAQAVVGEKYILRAEGWEDRQRESAENPDDVTAADGASVAAPRPERHAAAGESDGETKRARVSTLRIYLMCLGDFGLSFSWVLKYAVTTPYFQHTLHGGPVVSHFVWALGPLSGLITAPVVGVLSDQCTSSFGRRRPYILGGMLASILGMAAFSTAGRISFRPLAIVVAVLGFAVLDFSSNVIMFPSRALMGDLLVAEQQHDVQSAAAVIASVAEICAGGYVFSLEAPVSQIERLFVIASVIMFLSVSVSLYMCPEQPLVVPGANALASNERVSCDPGRGDIEMQSISEPSSHSEDTDHFDQDMRLAETGRGEEEEDDVLVLDRSSKQRSRGARRTRGSSDYVAVPSPESRHEASLLSSAALDSRGDPMLIAEDTVQASADALHLLGGVSSGAVGEAEGEGDVSVAKSESPVREVRSRRGALLGQNHARLHISGSRSLSEVALEVKNVVLSSMRNYPRPLVKVGVVYFLSWACWFACLPAYSVWIGESVLGGKPNAASGTIEALNYERGVNVFSLASMFKALIALAFSACYPFMVRIVGDIGERVVFGVPFLVFSAALWIVAFTHTAFLAGCVVVLGAIPFIATQTIPIAIAVAAFPENLASNLGILNLFCVSAQLFDTLYTGFVAKVMGEGAVMRVASGWACVAGIAAFALL